MSLNSSVNFTNPPAQASTPDWSVITIPIAICLVTVLVCLVGLVGNGLAVYLLGFRVKLNQSTVYVLNLALADFIYLLCCCMVSVYFVCLYKGVPTSPKSDKIFSMLGEFLHSFGFNSSLFFLATLCIERCLTVCFPLWYKFHRPSHLSAILCGIIWIVSVLITVLERFLIPQHRSTVYIVVSVVFLIVTLTMMGSSVVLLLEMQKTSIRYRPMKLYVVVVTAVITFLISLVPATMVRLLAFFGFIPAGRIRILSYIMMSLCSAINSTINPYIYIVVGRWKTSVTTTQALESVFREEDGRSSDGHDSVETQQSDIEKKPSTVRMEECEQPEDS